MASHDVMYGSDARRPRRGESIFISPFFELFPSSFQVRAFFFLPSSGRKSQDFCPGYGAGEAEEALLLSKCHGRICDNSIEFSLHRNTASKVYVLYNMNMKDSTFLACNVG